MRIRSKIISAKILILFIFTLSVESNAMTFKEAINALDSHSSIDAISSQSKSLSKKAKLKGSWGDPKFKIAAKNFPQDTLRRDRSPMTGIELSISQKISLTTKYGNIEKAFHSLAKAMEYEAKDKKQTLTKALWEIVILKQKIVDEKKILIENLDWITKSLKVSKKLYANGKTSQQALFDIQIRKSEIERSISNKGFELSQINDRLSYIIGKPSIELDEKTIPWNVLNTKANQKKDNRELSLKQKLLSKKYNLTASKLNYIPDLTVSLGVTKRANLDENGDFVGVQISFPLPFSGESYSKHRIAVQEKHVVAKQYENYKQIKKRDILILEKEISKLKAELKIITEKTIEFAKNSRSIASKSYGLGIATYIELLQSELNLQKILLHKVTLESEKNMKTITLKYISGEPLIEQII